MGFVANNMATALNLDGNNKTYNRVRSTFNNHIFADEEDKQVIKSFIDIIIQQWDSKILRSSNLHYYGSMYENQRVQNLLKPIQEREKDEDKLVCMQSMRSVEPNVSIKINKY